MLNNFPTGSEWQLTVWNMEDIPKQIMALAKKVAKTTFSFQGIRSEGLDKKYAAIPTKRRHPIKSIKNIQ